MVIFVEREWEILDFEKRLLRRRERLSEAKTAKKTVGTISVL